MTATITKTQSQSFKRCAFPHIRAEKGAESYILSKNISKQALYNTSNWEHAPLSSKLQRFEARRKLERIAHTLDGKRKAYRKYRKYLYEPRWNQIAELADQLKEQFVKTEEFVAENHFKRQRYQQKIEQLRQHQEQTVEEIEKIKEDTLQLHNVKDLMEVKVKEYGFYEDYLRNVIASDPWAFKNVDSILDRLEALVDSRKEVLDIQSNHLNRLTEMHEEIKKFLNDKHTTYIGLTTYSNSLIGRLERAKNISLTSENLIVLIYKESMQKKIEFQTVEKTCWRLYRHMRERNFTKTNFKKEDVLEQLKTINTVLGILRKLTKRLREQ